MNDFFPHVSLVIDPILQAIAIGLIDLKRQLIQAVIKNQLSFAQNQQTLG